MQEISRDDEPEPALVLEDVRWTDGQWDRFLEILFGAHEAPEDEELPA